MYGQLELKRASIMHPLINDIYIQQCYGGPYEKSREDTLVIETNFGKSKTSDAEGKMFNAYLSDLLLDLPRIKTEAEAQVGPFDKVYIKLH